MQFSLLAFTILLALTRASYAQDLCKTSGSELHRLEEIMTKIHEKNDCDKPVELLRTEDEVPGFSSNGYNATKKNRSLGLGILKLFSGKETDEMIDYYASCGKLEGSHRFVANSILIQARDACLMPSPPGQLSWNEASKVAEEVGLHYTNQSLMSLNKNKDQIQKDALTYMATAVVHKQLKELIPHSKTHNKMLGDLSIIKELQASDAKTVKDFTTYKFAPEAPFELAEKVFPYVLRDKLGKEMPKSWDVDRRDEFLENMASKGSQVLAECLEPHKKRIGYGLPANKAIELRKKLEGDFCKKNPDSCRAEGCGKKTNLLSTNPAYSDMQMVQACVLKSMEAVVPDFTGVLIENELAGLENLKFSEEVKNKLIDSGKNELTTCLSSKKINYQTISTAGYAQTLQGCAAQVKYQVTKNVVSQSIADMKVFPPETASAETQSVIKKTLEPCMSRISKVKESSVSACIPVIEMDVASRVLGNTLSGMASEASSLKISQTITEYKTCVENLQKEALAIVPNDVTPLLDTKLLACSKNAIYDTSKVVGEETFKVTINENIADLKDPDFAYALQGQVGDKVKICITENLNSIASWKGFKEFNEKDGFDEVKAKCSQVATAFALSKLSINEAGIELAKLQKADLIKDGATAALILSNAGTELSGRSLAEAKKIRTDKLVEEAYLNRLKENPNLTTKEFISEFRTVMTSHGIKIVQANLIDKMNNYNKVKGLPPLGGLSDALTPQCLSEMQGRFLKDIKANGATESKENPINLITELIADGLNFMRKKSGTDYNKAITDIQNMCQNVSGFENLWAFLGDERLDFLFTARVQKTLIDKFTAVTEKAHATATLSLDGTKDKAQLQPFADNQREEMLKLIDEKFTDPKAFEAWLSKTTIMEKIKDGLPNMLSGDKSASEKLNSDVVGEIFKAKENNSFASEFSRIQLSANLGLKGYAHAKTKVDENVKALSWPKNTVDGKIRTHLEASLKKHWNPAEISADFNWSDIPTNHKEKIIGELYQYAVEPLLKGEEGDTKVIEASLTDLLSHASDKSGKSFNTKLEEKLSTDVKSNVGKGDVFKGIFGF